MDGEGPVTAVQVQARRGHEVEVSVSFPVAQLPRAGEADNGVVQGLGDASGEPGVAPVDAPGREGIQMTVGVISSTVSVRTSSMVPWSVPG